MSEVVQIYSILNDVAKQIYGEEAISVVDTGSFVSLGDKVLSSDTDVDAFTNTLVNRIGRTVFSIRRYVGDSNRLVRMPFEYGCIVQKIYVDLPEKTANNAWNIGNEDYTPVYAPVIKPSIKQKLFEKLSTWEIDVTIPDTILKTAFLNEQQMGVMIDAIFVAIENSMTVALQSASDMTRASFIAHKINGGKPCGAINLLEKYNTVTESTLTAEDCLIDMQFLKFASRQMSLWINRMRRMSTLFNEAGYKRHTPREDVVVNILADFASATSYYLQADTFHDDLVSLPLYEEVPFWQGAGSDYEFSSVSSINVKLSDTVTVNQSGILAVIYDIDAMGVTMTNRRQTTERNNKDEYTNFYNKATYGYFNDMSENGIVFYVA